MSVGFRLEREDVAVGSAAAVSAAVVRSSCRSRFYYFCPQWRQLTYSAVILPRQHRYEATTSTPKGHHGSRWKRRVRPAFVDDMMPAWLLFRVSAASCPDGLEGSRSTADILMTSSSFPGFIKCRMYRVAEGVGNLLPRPAFTMALFDPAARLRAAAASGGVIASRFRLLRWPCRGWNFSSSDLEESSWKAFLNSGDLVDSFDYFEVRR